MDADTGPSAGPPSGAPETAGADDTARLVAHAGDLARAGETALLARFVEAGFPADLADAQGNTTLMLAAYHGHASTVLMLVEHGADPGRANGRGQTPMAGAVFRGEDDVVAVLLAAGADPDAGTPSARQTARMFGREELLPHP